MSHPSPFAGIHARAGVSFLAVAVLLAATGVSVDLAIGALVPEQRAIVAAASAVVDFIAVWIALPLGIALLATTRRRRILAVAAAVTVPVVVQLTSATWSWLLIPFALVGAVAGYAVIAIGLAEHRLGSRRGSVLAIAALTVANLAAVAIGALHLLVWNPLAKAPGLTLDQVYAALEATDGRVTAIPLAWAILSSVLTVSAAAAALVVARRGLISTHQVVSVGLVLVHATTFFMWWAGFGLAMSLADTFATSGGDGTAAGWLLALAGTGCLAAAILLQLRRPAPAPRPETEDDVDPDAGGFTVDDADAEPTAGAAAPTQEPQTA